MVGSVSNFNYPTGRKGENMSQTPSVKQLDAVVRVLSNTQKLLTTGMFPGSSSQAVLESHQYISALLKQSQEQLQALLDEKLADAPEQTAEETQNAVSEG